MGFGPAEGVIGCHGFSSAQGTGHGFATAQGVEMVSGFTPSDIAGLTGWFDPGVISTLWQDSARTTHVSADNDPVGAFDPRSGTVSPFLQATAGSRLVYKATGGPNSKPCVNGDGSAKYMDIATAVPMTPGTAFIVLKALDAVATKGVLGFSNSGNWMLKSGSGTDWSHWWTGFGGPTDFGSTATNWNILTIKYTSTGAAVLYLNGGSASASFDPEDSTGTPQWRILRSNFADYCNGSIAAIVTYDSALSDANRGLVRDFLNTQYLVY